MTIKKYGKRLGLLTLSACLAVAGLTACGDSKSSSESSGGGSSPVI